VAVSLFDAVTVAVSVEEKDVLTLAVNVAVFESEVDKLIEPVLVSLCVLVSLALADCVLVPISVELSDIDAVAVDVSEFDFV
jgi:hypothetical protein